MASVTIAVPVMCALGLWVAVDGDGVAGGVGLGDRFDGVEIGVGVSVVGVVLFEVLGVA